MCETSLILLPEPVVVVEMPVLLKSFDELNRRVLSQPNKSIKKVKVTKAPNKSKVKVLTNRRMYVVVIPTEQLDETLNKIKEKAGIEEVQVFEVKKEI